MVAPNLQEDAKYKDIEELKTLFVQQMGSVALFDLSGKYIFINEGWLRNYGITESQKNLILGHDVREFVPDSLIHDVIRTGKPISGMCFWPNSGEEFFLAANYVPLYDNNQMLAVAMYSTFNSMDEANSFYNSLKNSETQLKYYKKELISMQQAKYSIDDIIGESKAIKDLKQQIMRAANTSSNVIIEGETGCGKELIAHSIHSLSQRSAKPFIKLNCSAIPGALAESELFGYEHGAFTGASKGGKIGKFEMANGGSLFLDEINTLSIEIQPKLLRVLQEKEIERVGGGKSIPVDVRIIAASNKPLSELVDSEEFRRDLYYRLNVVYVRIPPLRERKEDIPVLAKYYMEKLNAELHTEIERISKEALDLFAAYDWPGNVRELQNVLERAMNWKTKGVLWPDDFSEYFLSHSENMHPILDSGGTYGLKYHEALDLFEEQYIRDALEKYDGNKRQTAEKIGLSRAMFYRKLEKYGIK